MEVRNQKNLPDYSGIGIVTVPTTLSTMENHGKLVQLMCIVISNHRTILYIKYILMS